MHAPTQRACPSCGIGLLAGDRFCPSCGTSIGIAATAAAASPWDVVLRRLRAATLGEFEIKRELGRGGMAAVYLAHDIALDLKVAIKVMAPGIMMGEGMVERFRLEAVTVANLSHPNIVRVHALRQVAEDLYFIVMQYVPGRTLERVVHDAGPLPIPIVRTILGQVGRALAHAHKRGVVHRDVKPGNIMLDANGDVVVTDFGIAKVATAQSHTLTGSVVGTPAYMSPEQCFAQPLTGASDQYSLGVVAFEMLTGRVPFSGAAYAVMQGHTVGAIPAVRGLRPDCPPDLEAAVTRMLAKEPADRFLSMSDAVAAAGSPAPGEQDPLRDELVRFAAVEESAALDARYPTPVSPVPQTRASVARVAPPAARPETEPPQTAPAPDATPPRETRADETPPVATRPAATPPATSPTPPLAPPPPSRPPATRPEPQTAAPDRTVFGSAVPAAKPATQPATEPAPHATRPGVAARGPSDSAASARSSSARRVATWAVPIVAVALGIILFVTRPWADGAPGVRDTTTDTTTSKSNDSIIAGPGPGTTNPPPAVRFRIADVPLAIAVGDTFTLGSIFSGPDSLAVIPNQWSSRAPAVIGIDAASGRARALREGVAVVAIRRGALTDSVALRVLPAAPPAVASRLVIAPPAAPLRVADRVRLSADAVDATGRRRRPSAPVSWTSSDPSVAYIDPSSGELLARAAGRAVISARSAESRATLAISVARVDPPVITAPEQPKQRPRDTTAIKPLEPEPVRDRPPPPKTPAELRAEIEVLVGSYARAFEAEDLTRLRGLNPSMAPSQVAGFRDFFEVARDVKLTVEQIDAPAQLSAAAGSQASVVVRYRIEYYNTVSRRTERNVTRWQVQLERTATGWRVRSIE